MTSRTLPVLIKHEEDPMKATLTALDSEWTALDRSPASALALRRWASTQPALAGLDSLGAVLGGRCHS
ncbi:MAG TPA: hypothetical protein VNF50_04160 [Acidimicrobiales bacterium]|nr:hypothetical protein [Acidimicrobiales bacterium]